jgi:transcriptional regulator with XRE-family HTH domain
MSRKNFAHLLGKHIEVAGLKQTYVASTASISYNYLQRLLAGDRNPSEQVVQKLAEALRLTALETGELFATAGYAPPIALLHAFSPTEQNNTSMPTIASELDQVTRLTQQFYRLSQDVPEALQAPFLEEIKHLLNYARYKYVLSGGENLLELDPGPSSFLFIHNSPHEFGLYRQSYLNILAEIVGRLHVEPGKELVQEREASQQTIEQADDLFLDHSVDRSNAFVRELLIQEYRPQFVATLLTLVQGGVPWDIRCHVTKALPSLGQFDVATTEQLMILLRDDKDVVHGTDIRRRVVEACSSFFEAFPLSLPIIIKLLYPISEDDIYVALATIEVCGNIQIHLKKILEDQKSEPGRKKHSEPEEQMLALCRRYQAEIPKIQRQLLSVWEGTAHECIQFSMALHDLLGAPDTLLHSLREGLHSPEKLLQFVATRYLEHVLSIKPVETLELYKVLLQQTVWSNVRRTIAKALPKLLHCMEESSLVVRTLARTVIMGLATDADIYIRRAVADSAMQLFYIDREFLFILLRQMHNDKDQTVRSRLQPAVLQLAQIWLTSYAETAGFIDTKASQLTYSTEK